MTKKSGSIEDEFETINLYKVDTSDETPKESEQDDDFNDGLDVYEFDLSNDDSEIETDLEKTDYVWDSDNLDANIDFELFEEESADNDEHDARVIDEKEGNVHNYKTVAEEYEELEDIVLDMTDGREIGIDLGTTNSVVTYYDGGSVKTLKFGSESIIPSAVYFEEPGKIVFGKQAVNKRIVNPESGIRYFKRKLGDLKDRYFQVKYQKANSETKPTDIAKATYVVDTNVFIEVPELIKQFLDEDDVCVPVTVSEELNYHIETNPSTKFQAEKAVDYLDKHKNRIRYESSDLTLLPDDFFKGTTNNDKNDNKILSIALKLNSENPILITNDRGLRQKANIVDVKTQNYDEFRLEMTMNKDREESTFKVAAEEATQLFLRHLREKAMKELGNVTKAAIGIPASFTPQQEDATRQAAYAAGFDEIRLIREPFAAAIAYGYDSSVAKKILVYDWGGGTFDVSIIETEADGKYRNLGDDGDVKLGGEDITRTIVEKMMDMFEDEHDLILDEPDFLGISDEEHQKNKTAMYKAAEELKVQLSEFDSASFLVSLYIAPAEKRPFEFIVLRKSFETWIARFVQRTLQKTSNALQRAGLQYSDIDITVLAGGTSLIPYVQQQVEAAFGFKPNYEKNAAIVIAEGAAIYAASEFGRKGGITDKPKIFDKTMHHFGVLKNRIDFQMVIPSGSELPARESVILMPLHDYAETLEINVYRGDVSSRCLYTTDEDMMHIEKLTISNIPPRVRTDVDVEITFEMSKKYGLNVAAEVKDKMTGKLLSHGHVTKHSAK
ncbi:Hsp70 family protein [Peribacillus kribbensis]|uniref:Hsp70 family protein n=1 Tax=Peribacillus kribbensis TaxID=356658 RepID=UPI0004194E9C|nr:Hsp70 family protein [Peribacillus kribbensis]